MSEPKVSSPAAFQRKRKVLVLPELGADGTELVVEVQAIHAAELLVALKGIPGLETGDKPVDVADIAKRLEASREPYRAIAGRGLVAPEFCFGPAREDGKAWWEDLTFGNQQAIVDAICELSGLAGGGGVAEKAATFHGERRGGRGRRRALGLGNGADPASPAARP